MGLDCSHDAWHGAYSAFTRWRDTLTELAGYSFVGDPETPWRKYPALNWDGITEENLMGEWESTPEDPLIVLIAHSDCDGVIHPQQAVHLADRLEQLLPLVEQQGSGDGHIDRDGGYGEVTRRFITGLRLAAACGEDVEFC